MSELIRFLQVLYRYKVFVIMVPLITMVGVYLITRKLPNVYKSQARIATGLVDKSAQVLPPNVPDQGSEVDRKVESMIQMMLLKKMLDQVSYALILHDLTAPAGKAFRGDSEVMEEMSSAERNLALVAFRQKAQKKEELDPSKPLDKKLLDLLEDLGYDAESLAEKILVYRSSETSDYIMVEYEAPTPEMSAYTINTLCKEFIAYYSTRVMEANNKAAEFLYEAMLQKQVALNDQINALKNYKIQNRLLNLDDQAASVYGQLTDFETRREDIQKDIQAYSAAIRNIDKKFDPADRRYMESAVSDINQDIVDIKQRLKAANDAYIRSDYNPRLKPAVDSLRNQLERGINAGTDKYAYNPLVVKENLVTQRLTMENSLEMAISSAKSVQDEIDRLNRKFDNLVPTEAKVQEYQANIEIANKEYMEALQRYNARRLEANFPMALQVVEPALPGTKQPSKKMILVLASGVASLSLCLMVFFLIYYLDNSIRDSYQLANATGLPVLGHLNAVPGGLDRQKLWDDSVQSAPMRLFHSLIRSIRYELLNTEFNTSKVICVSSLVNGEGKSIVVLGLAWAFSKISKKVLIIDGNFDHSELSALSQLKFTDVWAQGPLPNGARGSIDILGNSGGDVSLLELGSAQVLQERFQFLRSHYDVILIEADSFMALNKAKEWIAYSDLLLMVFESGKTITSTQEPAIDYLKSLGNAFSGWVVNKKTGFS